MKLVEFLSTGFAAAALLVGAAAAQSPFAENVWSLDDGGLNWRPEHVSLGNYGTAVFSHTASDNTRALLLSRHDSGPPTPIWEIVTNPDQGVVSASADRADCHIALTRVDALIPGQNEYRLKKYSAAGHDWTYTFPDKTAGRVFADISSDGETIVTVLTNPYTGWNELTVFTPLGDTPVAKFAIPTGPIYTGALSGDGNRLALGIGSGAYVVDVFTGSILFAFANGAPFIDGDMALSMDGHIFVTSKEDRANASVYEWDGATYQEVYHQFWPGAGPAHAVAISDDSETVAISFAGNGHPSHKVGLFIIDLPSKQVIASEVIYGADPLVDYRPRGLDTSSGGRVVALAMTGDLLTEKIRFYFREKSTPIAAFTSKGQPYGIDVEPWGKWAAVGFDSAPLVPCNICLFRIGPLDLTLRGRPCIGATPSLEIVAQPGQLAWVIVTPTLRDEPVLIPGMGTLIVKLFGSYMLNYQVIPASGIGALPFPIQMDPSLIGTTLWVQGVTAQPMELTHQAFPIVMLP